MPAHVVGLEQKQFQELAASRSKGDSAEARESQELKLQNIIAFNQRKKRGMLREMMGKAASGATPKLAETKI